MSTDQDKSRAEQAPTKEQQKVESTELTDADLDKVAGGVIIVNDTGKTEGVKIIGPSNNSALRGLVAPSD